MLVHIVPLSIQCCPQKKGKGRYKERKTRKERKTERKRKRETNKQTKKKGDDERKKQDDINKYTKKKEKRKVWMIERKNRLNERNKK